jgi:hypothetical protein
MLEFLQEKLSEALHDAKDITFPYASNLENFARGVEHGLGNALIMVNKEPQANCAKCGEYKFTPLRRDDMGGYVCLTCIDRELNLYLAEKIKNKI